MEKLQSFKNKNKRYSLSRRATITAQSHNLLHNFRILLNLVLNDSSHLAKEIGTKIVKVHKIFR